MDAEKFGAFIAEARKEKNMTQAELAEKLQVTDKAVSRWERGVGFPDINSLEALAEALGLSVLELMRSEKIEENETLNVPSGGSAAKAKRGGKIAALACALAVAVSVCLGIAAFAGRDSNDPGEIPLGEIVGVDYGTDISDYKEAVTITENIHAVIEDGECIVYGEITDE